MTFKKNYIPWNKDLRGGHLSKEHRRKIGESNKGKKHLFSEEHNKKISEANKGRIAWNKDKGMSEEQKIKISIAHKGKHHSEETKRKMRETRKHRRKIGKIEPTKPEREFMRICEKFNLPYKYVGDGKIWIENKNPDFIEIDGRKEVIEIFGRYWHSSLYGKKLSLNRTYEETLEHYKKYGFKCVIFWDDEINEQMVLKKLKNEIPLVIR